MKRKKQNIFVVGLFLLFTFLMFSCEKDYFQWSLPEKGDLEISVISITNNNVKIKGNILTKKVGSIIEVGFLITSTGDFSIADKYILESNENNIYQFDYQGFNFNTSYQARFYIITNAGFSQSSSVQFTTLNIPGSPAVVLNNYTDLLSDKVTVSGQVTLEGDFPVLARGFCWSTSSNPTVNNSLSNNGTGLGYFSQTITNLDPNTNYYVRAYASNQISTTYSNQIEFKTNEVSYNIGDYHQGGFIFYIFQQGDIGYVSGEIHGLIAASQDQGNFAWGCNTTSISTQSIIGSGTTNTQNIANNCGESNIAAKICANLTLNSYNDWYLPSSDELIKMRENLLLNGYGNFSTSRYWSSTAVINQTAIWLNFNVNGTWYGYAPKEYTYKVRAIRSF
jgi:hypothetical protein